MSSKTIFVIVQTLFVQYALSQYLPGFAAPYNLVAPGLDFTPTSGGGLPVSSGSAIPPYGIAVDSENFYEGFLVAGGELPFIGTVGFEGVLPTSGVGAVNHACGNGVNAMVNEPAALAPGYPGAIVPAAVRRNGYVF